MRRHKRELHLETKQQRVVVRGWDCMVSPVRALEVFVAANKVEVPSLQKVIWAAGHIGGVLSEGGRRSCSEGVARHSWGCGVCCGSVQHEDGEL